MILVWEKRTARNQELRVVARALKWESRKPPAGLERRRALERVPAGRFHDMTSQVA